MKTKLASKTLWILADSEPAEGKTQQFMTVGGMLTKDSAYALTFQSIEEAEFFLDDVRTGWVEPWSSKPYYTQKIERRGYNPSIVGCVDFPLGHFYQEGSSRSVPLEDATLFINSREIPRGVESCDLMFERR